MGGQGPAPKPKEQRRTRHEPQRGEWVDLPPLEKPVLPELPGGDWSERTLAAWKAWRADPVTSQYAPADIQAAIDLAYIYEAWVGGKDYLAGEFRQRQDRLGLNPKGKRDLRWRIAGDAEKPPARRSSAKTSQRRARLSVVK